MERRIFTSIEVSASLLWYLYKEGVFYLKIEEFRPKLTQFHDLKFSSCKFIPKFH